MSSWASCRGWIRPGWTEAHLRQTAKGASFLKKLERFSGDFFFLNGEMAEPEEVQIADCVGSQWVFGFLLSILLVTCSRIYNTGVHSVA
jgi:hypothetical protein